MNRITTTLGSLLFVALLIATRSEAATVQYVLDQSNTLEDNIDYLLVTISDNQPGRIDFLVETQAALNDIVAGDNAGIASFGFNLSSTAMPDSTDFLLPDQWRVQFGTGMSVAGMFDVRIAGTGQTRQDPLEFSILGLSLADIMPGFAAHVVGFHGPHGPAGAFLYGDRLVTAVPVPAALWLFGSGMLLLSGLSRRRHR